MTCRGWRKSSHSGPDNGDCVEVDNGPTRVRVRDSKQRADGPVLTLPSSSWAALLDTLR
ncbi:DUF397 domain-containing protein [Streptomyces sichuanensis]|uniref:DUF397 domain-containing protein n=1 Tax=Streptomyces sichuanensis TaxID=2871810 RepID=UPI0027E1174C|nr:DUF397 domain-containing protein [Streptomyces sichuanensis]